MKQPRKPVLKEKKILSEDGLIPVDWMVEGGDEKHLRVVHKKTGERKLFIKNAPWARKPQGAQKNKKDSCIIHRK